MTTTTDRARRRSLANIGHEFAALDEVPQSERTFGFADQAAFWFAATCLPAAWFYGALMAGATGLPGAFLLILIVSPLSLLPWALLGWIAARTGACSTAMVRPAFGLRGSAAPSVLYLVFALGWAAVNVFLGAIGLSFVFAGWLGTPAFLAPGYETPMAASIVPRRPTQLDVTGPDGPGDSRARPYGRDVTHSTSPPRSPDTHLPDTRGRL